MTERLYRPLTAADWDSLGGDRWLDLNPLVEQTVSAGGVLTVYLDGGFPTQHWGLPMVPLSEAALDIYMENPADGQRHPGGPVELGQGWEPGPVWDFDIWGEFDHLDSPPWIRDAANSKYYFGHAKRILLGPASAPAGFEYQIRIPRTWWSVDLAVLLFAFTSFHSLGGSNARDYLDREALLLYSAGLHSYLRRRRLNTHRVVGESLMDHTKRLALEAGAMMRWGGFVDGSSATQQWGLGVLDWDNLRDVTTIMDADPAGDAGADMFLTGPVSVRWTDEFVINSALDTWGSGWVEYFVGGSPSRGHESPFKTRAPATPDYPVPTDGPANELRHDNDVSKALRGERSVERALPSVLDRESADNVIAARWSGLRRVVEFPMGPLHWDFDPGDLVHLKQPESGLDGSEDLLVTEKVVDWSTLHATITSLEVSVDPIPMEPTDTELGDRCEAWLKAGTGIVESGGVISSWTDSTPYGRVFVPKAGTPGPLITTTGDGLSGLQVADFGDGTTRGLWYDGRLRDWNEFLPRFTMAGVTIIAVVKITDPEFDTGVIVRGVKAPAGTNSWGYGVRNNVGTRESGFFYFNENFATGEDADPVTEQWYISTFVLHHFGGADGGPQFEVLAGAENNGGGASLASLLDIWDLSVGFSQNTASQPWPGHIAEAQVYSAPLRPEHIRRLHADIRARCPGEGL